MKESRQLQGNAPLRALKIGQFHFNSRNPQEGRELFAPGTRDVPFQLETEDVLEQIEVPLHVGHRD
jgi:hypothetical protein